MPNGTKTYQEFSQAIKEKYPEYKDVDDLMLAQKMVEKYPEYKESVVFDEQPLKKKVSTETGTSTSSASAPLIFKDVEPYTGAPKSISNQFVSETPSTESKAEPVPEVMGVGFAPLMVEEAKVKKQKEQQRINERTQMLLSENPLFSPQNPNFEKNKQSYIAKLDELGYDKKQLAEIMGTTYEPTAFESVLNKFEQAGESLKTAYPSVKQSVAEIVLSSLPMTEVPGMYEGTPVVNTLKEWRQEGYEASKEMEEKSRKLPTVKLTESIANKDIAKTVAGIVGATVDVGSSAIGALMTGGAYMFTQPMAQNLYEYNSEKAKQLGVSVDDLYAMGENGFTAPLIISTTEAALETLGLGAIGSAVTKNIKSSATKEVLNVVGAMTTEGLTEWVQGGLEEYNKLLGQGKGEGEAAELAGKYMVSKDGLESALAGLFGAGGVTVGGRLIKQSSELDYAIQKANEEGRAQDAEMYQQKKDEIETQKEQLINQKVQKDLQKVELNVSLLNDKDEVQRLNSELNRPDITDTEKEVISETIQGLNSSISQREGYNTLLTQIESAKTEKDLDSYLKEADEKGLASPELMDEITLKRQQINEAKSKTVDTEVAAEPTPTPEADIPATTETKNVEPIQIKEVQNDYELNEGNLYNFEYNLAEAVGGRGTQSYILKGDSLFRIKGHTPNWDNFRSDLEDNDKIKRVINVTVGNYNDTDYRRNKAKIEELEQDFPNVEFYDVVVEDGESINNTIKYLNNILTPKTDAIQEPSAEGVFPRQQGEIRETGGERERMGQRVEGTEIAQESQKEIRADEKAQAEGMSFETEEEFDRYVLENSQSPKELAETYQRRLSNKIDSFGALIDIIKQRGLKMPFESWKRFGEPRDVTENKKLYDKYIDENATPLDEVAQELGYTPEDIMEAIRWNELKKLEPKGNPITEKIKEKYEALTGKKLTPKTARESVAEMTDEEAKELAALEKDYEKAIATGRLSVIDGEIVSQPELKTYKRDVSKRIKTLKDKFAEFEQYFAQKVKPEEGKRKQAKSERKAFMEGKDPRTQYIMENMDNILKQLVEKGVVTTNCL